MQGKLPCHNCPYGEICEECPELKVRTEEQNNPVKEKGGFYSRGIIETIGPDGKKHYTYSNPE